MEVPAPTPGEVLIQTAYSCVSPGTELRCLAGQQAGITFPTIPGYTLSGTVLLAGAASGFQPGERVFCRGTRRASLPLTWGGHVSHAVLPANQVFRLPDTVDLRDAAAIKLAAIAFHGVRLSAVQPQETVLVIGLGVIGQCAARLYASAGARVIAVDAVPSRVKTATVPGIQALTITNLPDKRLAALLPEGADLIVDATGVPAVLPAALNLAKALPWHDDPLHGTRYVVQGSYAGEFSIPYQAAFVNEVTFLIPRDEQAADVQAVIDRLADGRLKPGDLLTETAAPEDAPAIYHRLQHERDSLLTAVFAWQTA